MDHNDEDGILSKYKTSSKYQNSWQHVSEDLFPDFLYPWSHIGLSDKFGRSNSTTIDSNISSYPMLDILSPVCTENLDKIEQELDINPYAEPFLKIIEEPAHNQYRFRYGSEGDTAGTIPGERQKYGRKSFPKIILELSVIYFNHLTFS